MNHETAAATWLAAGDAVWRKFCSVVTAHHGGILQQLVSAAERQAAAELAGAAGIRHHVESFDAAWKFGLENLDGRDVQIAQRGGERRGAVVPFAAAVGRAEDF